MGPSGTLRRLTGMFIGVHARLLTISQDKSVKFSYTELVIFAGAFTIYFQCGCIHKPATSGNFERSDPNARGTGVRDECYNLLLPSSRDAIKSGSSERRVKLLDALPPCFSTMRPPQ